MGEEGSELSDDVRPKAKSGQIVLIEAIRADEVDGGQEVLQCLLLLGLDVFLAVLDLLQAQIGFEAAAHSVVERELEGLIGGGAQSNATVERIGRGGGVRRLRTKMRCGGGHSKKGKGWRQLQIPDKMSHSGH